MVVLGVFLLLLIGIASSLLFGAASQLDSQIFWILRLPRAISGIAVGGGLAVSGVVIQAVFGNPLADPFTTGIASAAALGAVIGSVIYSSQLLGPNVFAFLFSLLALAGLTLWLRNNYRSAMEILLVGVVAGMFCTAAATFILAISDPASWASAMSWMLGSLSHLALEESLLMLGIVIFGCVLCWFHWKPLDIIAVDQISAESVGVDVEKYRKRLFFLVAFITACCVSIAGVVGFVGLIVPHMLRRLGVRRHIALVPLSFVGGAGLVLCSDVLARVIVAPSEMPVGVVMALIGAPVFLFLVKKQKRVFA